MFFSSFRSASHTQRGAKTITPRTLVFNQTNDWFAYNFDVSEPTEINGFIYNTSSFTGINVIHVGISTSLGQNGIFPYVISEEFMNSNTGIAKTIAFEYYLTDTVQTGSNSGLGNVSYLSSATGYTLNPHQTYWMGIKLEGTTGSLTVYDMAVLATTDQIINTTVMANSFQRLNSVLSGISTVALENMIVVPTYTNPATGTTINYTKYPVLVDDTFLQYNSATYNEFGLLFEFNVFPLQDWDVRSIIVDWIDTDQLSSEYCMRVYDGQNFDNLIGTGITLTPYDIQATIYGNPAEYEFIFNPPLKLRTNKTYFAGIAWTSSVALAGAQARIYGNYNYNGLMSDQSSTVAYRSTVGSGALTTESNLKIPLNMYITRSNSVNRSIGN